MKYSQYNFKSRWFGWHRNQAESICLNAPFGRNANSGSARWKNFSGKADFVYQSGEIDRVSTDATADSDVSAFVL